MTQVQVLTQMNKLYDRLAAIGLSKAFLRENVLPDWWCDEYEQQSDPSVTAAAYLSKFLNLDFESLLNEDCQPKFNLINQPQSTLSKSINIGQNFVSAAIAAKVADVVAFGCRFSYQSIANLTPAEIRQEILASRRSVDLEGFLDFCWGHGLPVVHFSRFPSGFQSFQGMSACFRQRPVIVLSLDVISPSRLLFIAAHEFGHILKGHLTLSSDQILVDQQIDLESQQDEEASQVAMEILNGHPSRSQFIAHEALESTTNAPQLINRYLLDNLDWDRLGNDYVEYLESVLGLRSDREMF